MHRLLSIMLSFMFALTLIGCEQVVDVELPFERRIVVNGFIGRQVDTILWLSQTLPVGVEASERAAALRGAQVTVEVDGQVYECPEIDTVAGGYALPRLSTWVGKTVTLSVRGGGMEAKARTHVPEAPGLLAVQARRVIDANNPEPVPGNLYDIEAVVRARQPGVLWGENPDWFGVRWWGEPVVPLEFWVGTFIARSIPDGGVMEGVLPLYSRYVDPYDVGALPDSIDVVVCAADLEFARFLDRPHGGSNDGFGFGGVNPYFNVTGQGIGLFIGVASTSVQRLPLERLE